VSEGQIRLPWVSGNGSTTESAVSVIDPWAIRRRGSQFPFRCMFCTPIAPMHGRKNTAVNPARAILFAIFRSAEKPRRDLRSDDLAGKLVFAAAAPRVTRRVLSIAVGGLACIFGWFEQFDVWGAPFSAHSP
jgi:hypothetical protein